MHELGTYSKGVQVTTSLEYIRRVGESIIQDRKSEYKEAFHQQFVAISAVQAALEEGWYDLGACNPLNEAQADIENICLYKLEAFRNQMAKKLCLVRDWSSKEF